MNGEASNIGVVEVEIAERSAVGEGRQLRRRAAVGADDGGVAADRQCNVAANANWPLVEGADAASDRIDQVRLDPLDGCRVDILKSQAVGIGRESFRKRGNGLRRRRLLWTVLRVRQPGGGRECRSTGRQAQNSSTSELHGISSISICRNSAAVLDGPFVTGWAESM